MDWFFGHEKKKDAQVPPAIDGAQASCFLTESICVITGGLLLRRSRHVVLIAASKQKKASAAAPTGHDYRQPKLEEGADAF